MFRKKLFALIMKLCARALNKEKFVTLKNRILSNNFCSDYFNVATTSTFYILPITFLIVLHLYSIKRKPNFRWQLLSRIRLFKLVVTFYFILESQQAVPGTSYDTYKQMVPDWYNFFRDFENVL